MCFAFVLNSFGAPLVFKITKKIESKEFVELATVDASKFRQIRVLIKRVEGSDQYVSPELSNRLFQAKVDLDFKKRLLRDNRSTQEEVNSLEKNVNDLQSELDKIKNFQTAVEIYTIEDGESILLLTQTENHSVIDSPPSKIQVMIKGSGTYKLFIYGTQ